MHAVQTGELAPPLESVRAPGAIRSLPFGIHGPARAAVVVAGWTGAALFFAAQSWVNDHFTGRAFDVRTELVTPLVDMLLWALLTPAVVWVCRRAPFERGRRAVAFAHHVPMLLVLCAVQAVAAGAVFWKLGFYAGKNYPLGPLLGALILCKSAQNAVSYGALAALVHALDFHGRMRRREVEASQLESRLTAARLHLLRMQLQPHFLFNTMHAISALIPRDPAAADRMLVQLSALLRLTMEQERAQSVPLEREIEYLQAYLDIQQVRFGDRLRVHWEIEPAARPVHIPPLLLQPLVENAIQHGIGDRTAGGTLWIRARVMGPDLELQVADDGRGPGSQPPVEGRGLGNTRARLREFARGAATLHVAPRSGGGTVVRMQLPIGSAT